MMDKLESNFFDRAIIKRKKNPSECLKNDLKLRFFKVSRNTGKFRPAPRPTCI